jgi:hypothetical protein
MTESLASVKKIVAAAAKKAQQTMSDKPPAPVELGGVADKLPRPGTVISPPPVNAPPGGGPMPGLPGGGVSNS